MTPSVLVRGAGVVCALGRDLPTVRAAGLLPEFTGPAGVRAEFPAPFDPARDLPRGIGRRLGRQTALALAAILEAVGEERGLEDAILVLGTAHGPMHETIGFIEGVAIHGPRFASPALFAGSLHNTMAGVASRELGIRGPTLVVCNGEATFESALSVAVGMLRMGRARRAVVGASDTFHPVYRKALDRLGRFNDVPLGEGGGALLLEAAHDDAPGVRVEVAVLGGEALLPRSGIEAVRLLAAGDTRGIERHRATAAKVTGGALREVSFPSARLGAFGSLGAVATAIEADRLLGLTAAPQGKVLLLQHPHGAPPAAVVLAGYGRPG